MEKKGFTLIELMVTIAIIGLLAAIALPKFADVTEDAKVANVQGNLASLRTASEMFMVKNETRKFTDMFTMGKDDLSEEFQDFYSKGKVPAIEPGRNLDHRKVGMNYGTMSTFDGVNSGNWGPFAYYVDVEAVEGEEIDGQEKKPSYYNYIQMYALLEEDTYGADINWREF